MTKKSPKTTIEAPTDPQPTILYKLTDQDGYTRRGEYNECKWGPGVTHSGTGEGELCGPGYIHAYLSPELAVLLNPIHAGIENPRLWRCKGKIALSDKQLKVGCVSLTTIEEIQLPTVAIEQKIKFVILCGKKVFNNKEWNIWADKWLSGEDRTGDAAYAAAAYAAADAANAAYVARAAAYAADATADAARAAATAYAATAYAAARAAADVNINLIKITKEAMK